MIYVFNAPLSIGLLSMDFSPRARSLQVGEEKRTTLRRTERERRIINAALAVRSALPKRESLFHHRDAEYTEFKIFFKLSFLLGARRLS